MSMISLKGSSIENLSSANNIGSAEFVQVTNVHSSAVVLTVATVGTGTVNTKPGTIKLAPSQSIILAKGSSDTLAGGSDGHLVATAVDVII